MFSALTIMYGWSDPNVKGLILVGTLELEPEALKGVEKELGRPLFMIG